MILIHKNYGVLFGADPPALPSWLLSLSVLKSCDEAKTKEKCLHFLRFLVGNRPRSSGKAWLLHTLSSAKLTKISFFPNAMEGHFFVFLRFRSGAHHVLAIWDDVLDNVTLYLKKVVVEDGGGRWKRCGCRRDEILMTTTHINGYLPYGMICAILYLNLDFME